MQHTGSANPAVPMKSQQFVPFRCRGGHPLDGSMTLSVSFSEDGQVSIAQYPGEQIEVFCNQESDCSAGIDPVVEIQAAARLASLADALPPVIDVPACRICGCTEMAPCERGCAWITHDRSLCSECALVLNTVANELEIEDQADVAGVYARARAIVMARNFPPASAPVTTASRTAPPNPHRGQLLRPLTRAERDFSLADEDERRVHDYADALEGRFGGVIQRDAEMIARFLVTREVRQSR